MHHVQLDGPEIRITEWRLPPGGATGHHRHAYDYVVVPLTDGELTLVETGGNRKAPIATGKAYFRKAGVEHDVRNETEHEIAFVEIELKR